MMFADTFYFFALVNRSDSFHEAVISFSAENREPLLTTAWILTEFADGLTSRRGNLYEEVVKSFSASSQNVIVDASPELMKRGVSLYLERQDKFWSLTDCISFSIMDELGINSALTADHHFEQAGFHALFSN